jgi:4-alpha-glucanotransferase
MKTLQDRSAGVLAHISSIPGSWANGDLGKGAHDFAAWAASAGCSWWQMLPCHPTGAGDSPYQCLSAFAGNPLFVSLEGLAEKGWLDASDLKPPRPLPEEKSDFWSSFEFRGARLRKALKAFESSASAKDKAAFAEFCEEQAFWLDDWALFAALKRSQGGRHWVEWEPGLRDAQWPALQASRAALEPELYFEKFAQFAFEIQWRALKSAANSRGLGLVGDLPIFVSHDSSDVWANRALFELDEQGRALKVAGVPPDYFSEEGQRWGNPLYRWEIHKSTGYRWWVARFARTLQLFDAVRVDHFIGFQRYWEIPAESPTAKEGRYVPGPGAEFFETLRRELGPLASSGLPIIAEDLGVVTPEVTALRKAFGLPGMRVAQFSFGGEEAQLPENYEEDSVAYSGTHDNNTTRGWLDELPPVSAEPSARAAFKAERELAMQRTRGLEAGPVWSLLAAAFESKSRLAVAPLQDLLELGAEARMNTPGTAEGNWRWRAKPGCLQPALAARLKALILKSGR